MPVAITTTTTTTQPPPLDMTSKKRKTLTGMRRELARLGVLITPDPNVKNYNLIDRTQINIFVRA